MPFELNNPGGSGRAKKSKGQGSLFKGSIGEKYFWFSLFTGDPDGQFILRDCGGSLWALLARLAEVEMKSSKIGI